MSSDKDKMLSSAKRYSNAVAAAKNSCKEAALALVSPENEVAGSWKGVSGDTMVQALTDVRMELIQLYKQLSNLEHQMSSHVQAIYNNWPDDEADIS